MKMKKLNNKRIRKYALWIVALCIACMALLLTCNLIVENNAKNKLYSDINSVTPTEYGLLLGTTPQTKIGRKPNTFFKYRIDAAEQLYKTGKIKKILISGDAKDIILDGKGYSTINSVENAVKIHNIHSFIVISQKFHNERAIYLAEHLNLDTNDISGFNAADATSSTAIMTYIREYFARVKMFIDILFY